MAEYRALFGMTLHGDRDCWLLRNVDVVEYASVSGDDLEQVPACGRCLQRETDSPESSAFKALGTLMRAASKAIVLVGTDEFPEPAWNLLAQARTAIDVLNAGGTRVPTGTVARELYADAESTVTLFETLWSHDDETVIEMLRPFACDQADPELVKQARPDLDWVTDTQYLMWVQGVQEGWSSEETRERATGVYGDLGGQVIDLLEEQTRDAIVTSLTSQPRRMLYVQEWRQLVSKPQETVEKQIAALTTAFDVVSNSPDWDASGVIALPAVAAAAISRPFASRLLDVGNLDEPGQDRVDDADVRPALEAVEAVLTGTGGPQALEPEERCELGEAARTAQLAGSELPEPPQVTDVMLEQADRRELIEMYGHNSTNAEVLKQLDEPVEDAIEHISESSSKIADSLRSSLDLHRKSGETIVTLSDLIEAERNVQQLAAGTADV